MSYKTLRVSDESNRDLCRALWIATRLNAAEGILPATPEATQAEAFGRIIREWSGVALHEISDQALRNLQHFEAADWHCRECGSSALNRGGLALTDAVRCAMGCK